MPEPDNSLYMQEADDLAAMVASPGWKVVRKYVGEQISTCVKALIVADIDKVKDLQAKIQALEHLVKDTENHIEAARIEAARQVEEGPTSQAGA